MLELMYQPFSGWNLLTQTRLLQPGQDLQRVSDQTVQLGAVAVAALADWMRLHVDLLLAEKQAQSRPGDQLGEGRE